MLRRRDFRRFFIGYTTSLLGSAMAATATTFALLDNGYSATDLGLTFATGILPILVCLPIGGVTADRFGSRRVMLTADGARFVAQSVFAVLLFTGHPPLWIYLVLAGVRGGGDGFFNPALSALIPRIVGSDVLTDANALTSVASSAATVVGPTVSGLVVAAFGSAAVVALDAASFAVSVLALASIRPPRPESVGGGSMSADLREGWVQMRRRAWVWVTTIQFALFNLVTWAPFLVLGPVLAHERYGGARMWGLTIGSFGAGAIAGGLAMIGRDPRRPLVAATIATFGYALAPAGLACHAPLAALLPLAFGSGIGSGVGGTLYAATNQRLLPPAVRGRVSSLTNLGAFVFGPLGLAVAGPLGTAVGFDRLLLAGAVFQVLLSASVLRVPAIRALRVEPPSSSSVPAYNATVITTSPEPTGR